MYVHMHSIHQSHVGLRSFLNRIKMITCFRAYIGGKYTGRARRKQTKGK